MYNSSNKLILLISIVLCILFVQSVVSDSDYAISPVSLLLPYSTSKFRKPYKLEANKGCFEWINTNPDLVEITPIYETAPAACDNNNNQQIIPDISLWDNSNLPSNNNNKRCSKAVLVSVRSGGSSSERNSAFIYAEEQVTGKKLQCEVFVDRISSIVIETTTKTMYKDDLEELHVRAYDSVGNVFSSIIGLEFEWSITAGNIIQIVPFRGFPLDDVALKMEHDGLQTSFVLVQGVDTGRTQVTTKLTDNTYKDIQHSTTISILEPLQLNPSYLLYVISGTQIQYQLLTKKRTVLENIPLPNPNYIWSSSNSKVGKVDDSGNFMAMELGRTDLKVQHKNMSDNKVQALVNVVHPSYLAIKIEPLKSGHGPVGSSSWNLIEQRNYILTVELYDASAHKIHSSDITFDLNIPSDYFKPLPSNQIPSTSPKRSDTFYLKAIKQGTIQLKASLIKVYDLNLKKYTALLNPISVEQEVTIHSQISLSPPIVYLPHLPKNKQTYSIRVNGGSGEYNWYTNNSAIVQVDSLGGISSQQSNGQTEVIVVDKKNPHNRDQVLVVVLTPDEIIITPSRIEVQVGSTLQLSTKLLSKQLAKGIHFDSCNLNDLEWKVESSSGEQDKSFSILPVSSNSAAAASKESLDLCSIREFLATKEGSSVASVYYNGMKASVRIFAYAPLKADHDEILLSLGSSSNVFFRGGPDPWYLEPKSHFQNIVSNSTDQSAISIVPGNGNSFRVTCLQHTSSSSRTFITVTVGNKVSNSNPLPASPSISIPYSCRVPVSIQLQVANLPKETLDSISESSSSSSTTSSTTTTTTLPSCQDTIFSIKKQKPGEIGTYKIRNNRDIPFIAQVYDDLGKAFTNYSSLIFDWKSSDASQAKWLEDYNQIDHLSTLSLSKEQGKVIITSTIVGYDTELLKQLKVKQIPTLSNKISSSLELHLLSSVTLFPDSYTMYLSDKNHLKIEAIGGSKNFAFTSNSSKIASLAYQTGSDFVNVIPIQQGYLKVEVKDICLGSEPSTATSNIAITPTTTSPPSIIQISEVHSIELDVQDMVQVGDSIKLIVRGYAQNGQQFDESQYQYMNIIPHIDNPNVLSMIQSVDSQVFTLKGLDQGLVTLSVTIFNPKTSHSATSKTIQIQVFPPFRVSPSVLHLVPGGHFQIHWTGGAPIRQDVSFISSDNSIVNLSGGSGSSSKQDLANGELVALKVGEATITVIAQIVDPITGKKMLIGQDKLMVYVKNMTGIRIHSSINKILVGNEAKLRVVGANGETPFTYGTVDLFFKWECLDSNIATLAPIYEGANTTVEIEGSFNVRVIGKNAGSTSITVWAYSGSDRTKYLFQAASLQINVIPNIPFQCTTSLLLPLNTASSFITNNHLDKSGIEFYPLSLDGHSSSCKDVIDIGDSGKIVSLDKIGTCYVSAVRDGRMDTSKLMKINSKPFSHLELLPILPISSTVIPIGGSMSFSILLRDDIGEIFSEYGSLVVFSSEVSNTGIISSSIDGNIVTIKGIRAGLVTLHVYLKDMPHLDDYIKVFVGRLVEPHQPILHVGSTVQFSIAREQLEQRGYALPGNDEKVWATGDPSILTIDPVTGEATAIGTGVTTVNYIRNPSSQTQVVIAKIGRVKVDFNDQVINNSAGEKYSYNLKFFTAPLTKGSSEFEFTPQTNVLNQNIKGVCSIQESTFANAYFEKVTSSNGKEQQYRCVVQPTGVATSTIERVTLFIQVSNNDKSYVFESTVSLPFESTFSVLNVKSNKIQLSARQSTYILSIQSSNPIFVESSDNSVLSVQQLSGSEQTGNNIFKYVIQPMNPNVGFTSVPLYISSADGKSKTTINVSFSKSGATPVNEPNNNNYVESSTINSHPFLFSFLIIATTLIAGLYISKQHNSQPRVYIAPNQNLQSSAGSSSTSSIPSSPFRTPPPNSFSSPNRSTYGSSSIYLNNK